MFVLFFCFCYFPQALQIQINFQDASTTTPAGWLPDNGLVYADRGNGHIYGWHCGPTTTQTRNRAVVGKTDLENTFVVPDRLGTCPNEHWDISVPNHLYSVQVFIRDVSYSSQTSGCTLEGSQSLRAHGGFPTLARVLFLSLFQIFLYYRKATASAADL